MYICCYLRTYSDSVSAKRHCKYTTSKCVCQEFLLKIFTINFRNKSNHLTINPLAIGPC